MNENEKTYLNKFYNLLRDNLRREKHLKSNSVLISFLTMRSAPRYKALSSSTISSNFVPRDILMELLSKGYVQVLGNINTYAITAKGVWHCEQDLDLMNEDRLLRYINNNFFTDKAPTAKKTNELDDREKTILFAMISARAFSETSIADLKRSDVIKDKWLEVLKRSYDLLDSLQIITKLNKDAFFNKAGNEHVASSIFRHNNAMVQKTRGIYGYKGNYQYYLNLFDGSTFSTEKLSYLFWKIFEGNVSTDSVNLIVEHCNNISSKESIFLFEMEEHIFSMPSYDSALKDGLLDSIISKSKWAKIG